MGDCIYCGKAAGLFKKKHKECEQNYNNGWKEMLTIAATSAIKGEELDNLKNKLHEISQKNFVEEEKVTEAIISGWEIAVEKFLEDGVLTEEKELKLDKYSDFYQLSQDVLDRKGAFNKVAKAGILREVLNGKIPENLKVEGQIPFNFQKQETLVWIFQNVPYYEQKIRKHYEGGYGGFSIKVAKGLYYRTGAFKGHPVTTTEMAYVDSGLFGITDKHIYFGSNRKNFRVKYDKIVTFTPYDDGIGIQRDATTAKPQIFKTGDGWFTYNLITNLAQS